MKAKIEAARGICLSTAVAADLAKHAATPEAREAASLREELLTPLAKGWSTDVGVEAASMGLQVHGGMGFIEETGAAQHYRDARILPIYEGTNGIQAMDLTGRKLSMAGGGAVRVADRRHPRHRGRPDGRAPYWLGGAPGGGRRRSGAGWRVALGQEGHGGRPGRRDTPTFS